MTAVLSGMFLMSAIPAMAEDAMKSGNNEFAQAHLKRFQAATYIEQQCPTIMQWYRDSK